jgi:hypothetical protein
MSKKADKIQDGFQKSQQHDVLLEQEKPEFTH